MVFSSKTVKCQKVSENSLWFDTYGIDLLYRSMHCAHGLCLPMCLYFRQLLLFILKKYTPHHFHKSDVIDSLDNQHFVHYNLNFFLIFLCFTSYDTCYLTIG